MLGLISSYSDKGFLKLAVVQAKYILLTAFSFIFVFDLLYFHNFCVLIKSEQRFQIQCLYTKRVIYFCKQIAMADEHLFAISLIKFLILLFNRFCLHCIHNSRKRQYFNIFLALLFSTGNVW